MRMGLCADRAHPLAVVADAAQCQAERRINEPPRAEKDHKQRGERVAVSGVAVEIETESAKNRPGMDALQAIETAGEPARAVRRFLSKRPIPSVVMISGRWRNRAMMKLVT